MADAAIKSARRVFEIMEFFDRARRPLGLKAICDELRYPVSSGAAMLKSLVTLGYLEYDRKTQTYLPTMRIAVSRCFSRPSRGCAETTYGMVTNASTVRISVPCCDLHAPKPGVLFVATLCQP